MLLAGCRTAEGSEGGACYGNGTCGPGLMCRSDLCIRPGDAGKPDGGPDAGRDGGADAGTSDSGPDDAGPADAGTDAAIDDAGDAPDAADDDAGPDGGSTADAGFDATVRDDMALDARVPACGDSMLDPGEACDDGAHVFGDGCSGTCQIEVCGNGVRDIGERCDRTPGCLCAPGTAPCLAASCDQVTLCGNGALDPESSANHSRRCRPRARRTTMRASRTATHNSR